MTQVLTSTALRLVELAVSAARERGDLRELGSALRVLARVRIASADLEAASAALGESRDLVQRVGDEAGLAEWFEAAAFLAPPAGTMPRLRACSAPPMHSASAASRCGRRSACGGTSSWRRPPGPRPAPGTTPSTRAAGSRAPQLSISPAYLSNELESRERVLVRRPGHR
jgi:hypothetical protein